MSFSFGFGRDSQEDVECANRDIIPSNVPVELFTVENLMETLAEKISFREYDLSDKGFLYCQRELFDIRHQLMSQDDDDDDKLSESEKLFLSSPKTDIKKGIYEGGLKTWEGSFDLIDCFQLLPIYEYNSIIELGCGSGLPSIFRILGILKSIYNDNNDTSNTRPYYYFTLADFNKSVLELFTFPNLFVSWAYITNQKTLDIENMELLVTMDLKREFINHLNAANIHIRFLSGPWGAQGYFDKLQWWNHQSSHDDIKILVLAAETIYSLDYLDSFTRTLEYCLNITTTRKKNNNNTALVAGKRSYFGVGGGIVEFIHHLPTVNPNFTINEIDFGQGDQGIKRFVLNLTLDGGENKSNK